MNIKSFKDLIVWKKSMDLVLVVYELTRDFPKEEMYGLVQQMRRCAVSVTSNIAEGRERKSSREFLRFINIASGSLAELETQFLISEKLGYIGQEDIDRIISITNEIGKMLSGLRKGIGARG